MNIWKKPGFVFGGFLFGEFCWLGKLDSRRHSLLCGLRPLHLLPPVANSFSLVSRRHPVRIRDDHGGIVPTYRISQASYGLEF
jgi:hypothetical protein